MFWLSTSTLMEEIADVESEGPMRNAQGEFDSRLLARRGPIYVGHA
jgi:hypothetical protein